MSEKLIRDQDKFMLRMPDGMRDRIRDAAEANKRSMNAEIVARLEESFQLSPQKVYGVEGSEISLMEEIRLLRRDLSNLALNGPGSLMEEKPDE